MDETLINELIDEYLPDPDPDPDPESHMIVG